MTIRDLVRNALRMRPERIVVGECRGGETLDMLQAMNTGHDGSLTTLHSNTPRDALARIETITLMAGIELPVRAIREQLASAIHLMVHRPACVTAREKSPTITEMGGMEGEKVVLQEIFKLKEAPTPVGSPVVGCLLATGLCLRCVPKLEIMGASACRRSCSSRRGRHVASGSVKCKCGILNAECLGWKPSIRHFRLNCVR